MSTTATKLQIPPHVADRLLELLATDDGFRELFARDRHAALVQVGVAPELVQVAPLECMKVERLASKSELAATRAELVAGLTSTSGQVAPHALEAQPLHARGGSR
ncbi:putative modified peptide [Kribbella sandramycini]|uniref:Putative modified peptide n=1 Tax=Kribbella sandramycini TaxID=60450 RepID=A0A7Y4L0N0_9ACTN|nr:NHLP-related RiPP peptide [Kribbella sandramycini]MBB6569010.1 putative modified peptide [Kribbella sandramycini]NOL41146.1 putative modified peptide [Kribbella sandramycini]